MNEETISIREYAEITGVSVQAIHKRIKANPERFKPYLVTGLQPEDESLKPDGKGLQPRGKAEKRLKSSILDDSTLTKSRKGLQPKHQGLKPSLQPEDAGLQPAEDGLQPEKDTAAGEDRQPDTAETASESAYTAHLVEEVQYLKDQLATKDKQIESLLKSLQAEQYKTAQLTARLTAPKDPDSPPEDPETASELAHEEDHAADRREEQPQRKGFLAWWHDLWN